jgi:DNA-binding beta-propeller fold protein YncE
MKTRLGLAFAFALTGCLLTACSGTSPAEPEDGGESVDALLAATCPRNPPPANRTRKVVVSHPFGDNPNRYEVLNLSSTGELSFTGMTFEMERAGYNPIVFTPDGKIGLVAHDNGSIGVFRFDSAGRPVVVESAFRGSFYGHSITVNPSGTRAYVVDRNSEAHNGGIYELVIGCDGRLTEKGRVVPGGNAHALAFMPNNEKRVVIHAKKAFTSAETSDTFLVDVTRPALVAQGDGFLDQSALVSSLAITPDSKFALVADDSINAGNRVAIVTLPSMKHRQMFETRAPFALVTSVWNNAALVVNGDSADDMQAMTYDKDNDTEPFKLTGSVPWVYPRPQLPGAAVQITRGALKGRVLVAELVAVRQVQFTRAGAITDTKQTSWDKTVENIVGTVGVQP